MTKSSNQPIYRAPSAAAETPFSDDPAVQEWVARVAPEAAPFLERPRPTKEPAAVPEDAAWEPRPQPPPPFVFPLQTFPKRALLMWGAIAVMFFVIWQFVDEPSNAPPSHVVRPPASPSVLPIVLPLVFIGVLIVLIVLRTVRTWLMARSVNRAVRQLVLDGEMDPETLRAATKPTFRLGVAVIELTRSRAAFRSGEFEKALRHADAAGSALGAARFQDDGLALVGAERAAALAALGRDDEARFEIVAMPRSFAGRASAELRVRLLLAIEHNQFRDALRIAETISEDMPLDMRTALLADLVRVKRAPETAGPEALTEMRTALESEPLRRFVGKLAPRLLEDVGL